MDKELNKRDTMFETLKLIQSNFLNEIMVDHYHDDIDISSPDKPGVNSGHTFRDRYILKIKSFLEAFPLTYILSDSNNEDVLLMLGFKKIKIQETDETKELLNKYEELISLTESIHDIELYNIASARKKKIEKSITAYLMPKYFKRTIKCDEKISYYDLIYNTHTANQKVNLLDFETELVDYPGYTCHAVQFKDEQ